jgi:hypothetical protein
MNTLNYKQEKGVKMKTQMKAVWSILVMTTIWLTMNSSKINNQADEQHQINEAVNRMVQTLEQRESDLAAKTDEVTFEQAFAEARAELGDNNVFTWNGNTYTTNYEEKETYVFPSDDVVGIWVRNSNDDDDYCNTNDRDECGICGGDGQSVWYADRDADGLGDINTQMKSCEQPSWTNK